MIWLILALATVLRFIQINQSFWLDEAITAQAIRNYNLIDLITKFSPGDFHPPGFYIFLMGWSKIFGISEISLRIPSIIFGVLTVYVIYRIGKKLLNTKVGLIASFLFAVSPLAVYYSQEARMYSLTAFLVSLSFLFLLKLKEKKLIFTIAYAFSVVLILYTDYVAYFILPAQLIYILWAEKESLKKFIISVGLAIFFLLPWLGIFYNQLTVGIKTANLLTNWSAVVGGATLKNLSLVFVKTIIGRISFSNKYTYSFIVGFTGLLYLGTVVVAISKKNESTKLFLYWLFIPLVATFLISFKIPVLSYFRMLFILPAFYLLIAKGLEHLPKKLEFIILSIFVLVSGLSLLIFYTNPIYQREDWKTAASAIENLSQKNNAFIMLESNGSFAPLDYYLQGKADVIYGLNKIPALSAKDVVDLKSSVGLHNIYLFEYLVDITDPNKSLEKSLVEQGYLKDLIYNFNGVGFVTLYKHKSLVQF